MGEIVHARRQQKTGIKNERRAGLRNRGRWVRIKVVDSVLKKEN